MIRSITPSIWDVSRRGRDLQRQHAQRLLLSGFDVPSAAVLTGLPLSEVEKIAASADLQIKPTRP